MDAIETARPPRRFRLWKLALWVIAGLLGLVALLIAILFLSPDARDWAATRLLTDPVINERLSDAPPRTEAGSVTTTRVRTGDGIELSTQVFLPAGDGPWPVIIVRDPYSFYHYLSCKVFVRYGYACVHQEVRGRGLSEGDWYPFIHERTDGLDLIRWVLAQPWQNGNLALQGGSYIGVVQWAVAGDLPPEVKTFVPTVAHGDVYQLSYRNGMFNEGIAGVWSHSQFQGFPGMLFATDNWRKDIAGHFPAIGVESKGFGPAWTSYRDYLLHPDKDDAYWQSQDYVALREAYSKVGVPVFMIGYANDFFLPGMLKTYSELPTRDQSHLLIGPGNHGGQPDPEVDGAYTQEYADTLAWFDHHLQGAPLPERLRPGVTMFVHGENAWRKFDTWPSPPADEMVLYLGNMAASQACDGGALSSEAPVAEQPATYAYDPRNPVPTRGGPFELLSQAVAEQGNDLCERPDVLSFASAPLSADRLLNGGIRIRLQVASDAADTAFSVKLSEHFADGRVYNIRDDISSLSMRNGSQHRIIYTPGEMVDLEFNLTPIMWRLKKDSRLRLDITSSSAPAFFPHPNTAGPWSEIAEPVVAQQSIFGGQVILPLDQ